jgi:TetR/AcrR family transcriptional regulator
LASWVSNWVRFGLPILRASFYSRWHLSPDRLAVAPPPLAHLDGWAAPRYINNQLVINPMSLSKLFCGADKAAAPKRERRKDARPGELLAAALDLFVEKGFAATRAEEVAQRAGVSKGTLFLYFASKEELFKAVVRDCIADRYPAWHAELAAFSGTAADMLRLCAQRWWATVGATKASGISKLMMSEASNFPDLCAFYQQEVVAPGEDLIRRILQRGIDSGEFRAMDMKYAVYSVLAPMIFLMIWKHSLGANADAQARLVPEEFLAAQIEIVLHGLCLPGAGPQAPLPSKNPT